MCTTKVFGNKSLIYNYTLYTNPPLKKQTYTDSSIEMSISFFIG